MVYLLRATDEQAANLLYLAGYLAGAGLPEAADLKAILETAAPVPDGLLGEILDPDTDGPYPPDFDDDPIDVRTDPTAPENLGIALEQPAEYIPDPPTTRHEDFGAGPPPAGAD